MNCEIAVESITDLSDQNPEAATEQGLSVRCMEVEPLFTGIVLDQKDNGFKRKHCETFADREVREKKVRFQGDDVNVATFERKETNYEHESTKFSVTIKTSFCDEPHLQKNCEKSDDDAVGNLPENGKKGRKRKRRPRKIKSSENLNETEKLAQQSHMGFTIFENNAQTSLIAPQTEDNVAKLEKSMPNLTSAGSVPFPKLVEKPEPKADKILCKPSFSKPKPQVTAKPIENPKHKGKQQLNYTKVVNDSSSLAEKNSKSMPSLLKPVLSPSKPKRYEEVYIYGNYNRYYGYRSPELEEDARLSCFPQSFFQGKEVLDIGCNIGHVTLLIARDWRPKRIDGLDIDGKLICIAKKNVKHYLGHKNLQGSTSKSLSQGASNNGNGFNSAVRPDELFPNNVMFMQGNYVLARDDLVMLQKEEYDVILALSISKWIHLNFGDDGLKRTFQRVYHQLRPGGKFILEPQEWSSYKRKKKLTETIFENFKSIQFRPDKFRNYLLSDDVGFSSCELIGVPDNKSKGFRRPLLMFTKSSTQNRIESLRETKQQNSVTDECQSMLTSSMDTTTNKVVVASDELQSHPISLDFSDAADIPTHGKTEIGATQLNATDYLITQDEGNDNHSVSTQLTEAVPENSIIYSGELRSPSSQNFSDVASTHVSDETENGAAMCSARDVLITQDDRNEDQSVLTLSTDAIPENKIIHFGHVQSPNSNDFEKPMQIVGELLPDAVTEGNIIDSGLEQCPILQEFEEIANSNVNSETGNGAGSLNATGIPITQIAGQEGSGSFIVNIGEECNVMTSANDAVTCDVSNSPNNSVTCDVNSHAIVAVSCDVSNTANDSVTCDVSNSANEGVTYDISHCANDSITCDVSNSSNYVVTCGVSNSPNNSVTCDANNHEIDVVTCDVSNRADEL